MAHIIPLSLRSLYYQICEFNKPNPQGAIGYLNRAVSDIAPEKEILLYDAGNHTVLFRETVKSILKSDTDNSFVITTTTDKVYTMSRFDFNPTRN